jgi:hypothetical protein
MAGLKMTRLRLQLVLVLVLDLIVFNLKLIIAMSFNLQWQEKLVCTGTAGYIPA